MSQPNPVKKSVAETLNGLAILLALLSGLMWHLSTVGSGTSGLAELTSNENAWAAVLAALSGLCALVGLFKK